MFTGWKKLADRSANEVNGNGSPVPAVDPVHEDLDPTIDGLFASDILTGRESNPTVVVFGWISPYADP